ncbi:UNVERIFIED_CONTAM: Retrovirus-related Pol polyprotein from transposon RE1 [Sesamum indicum]
MVRSDNGTEFTNTTCQSLFRSLGIIHHRSYPHTPQSNGVVERKHRHILDVARALTTHLINKLPSRLLNWKSPYEILFHKVPTYSSLTVFGCLCFASNTSPSKYKFTPRAHKCVFLGYNKHHKGYKVLDLNTNRMSHSRDVVFYEDIFPFESHVSDPNLTSTDFIHSYSDDDDHTSPRSASISPAPHSTSSHSSSQSPTASQDDSQISSIPLTDPPLPLSSAPEPRRTIHTTHKPIWLNDYEPKSYAEASKDEHWTAAMNEELAVLECNKNWTPMPLPPGKKAIGCRWVFKLKLNPDGSVLRHKARLVAKGYNQIEGVDYFDSFSPVAKVVTVRVFLAVAVNKGWPLWQLDEVFMTPLEGYKMAAPNFASRQWNIELTTQLQAFGYTQCPHDHCLFLKITDSCFVALLVYVDDILLTGDSAAQIDALKAHLHSLFTIKDLGLAKYFLGLEFARSSHGLLVSQQKYLHDILNDANMLGEKVAPTPLPLGLKLFTDSGSLLSDPSSYRWLIGHLLYLGFTRPDVSFAVQQLSQFLQHPRSSHWDAAVHILRYLRGTSSLGIFFSSCSTLHPSVYTDASWASCPDSCRSISGYCIFLGSSLVSWKTKKQATVSRSSAEVEYRSMGAAVCELLWLSYLLRAFNIQFPTPIRFWCDNQAAIHERTNNPDIDCHLVRDQFKLGFILSSHIPVRDQLADIFTKSSPVADFARLLGKLGLAFALQLEGGMLRVTATATLSDSNSNTH